jgi:hypothetical protein
VPSSSFVAPEVREKLARRAADAGKALDRELERIRRDERRRLTSQVAIDMTAAEEAVCAAVAAATFDDRAGLLAVLEALRPRPAPPRAEVKDLERYAEQWARTCEQLTRDWS